MPETAGSEGERLMELHGLREGDRRGLIHHRTSRRGDDGAVAPRRELVERAPGLEWWSA